MGKWVIIVKLLQINLRGLYKSFFSYLLIGGIVMKKLLFILVVVIFSVQMVSAGSTIVMDQNSNRILYSNNISERMLIASTTKIMTALIAINYGNLESLVEVDKSVLKAYGSAIYIEVGEKIRLEDLVYGLMLRSGNELALLK